MVIQHQIKWKQKGEYFQLVCSSQTAGCPIHACDHSYFDKSSFHLDRSTIVSTFFLQLSNSSIKASSKMIYCCMGRGTLHLQIVIIIHMHMGCKFDQFFHVCSVADLAVFLGFHGTPLWGGPSTKKY